MAFDATNARRRLVRTHELGDTLGYNHVHSRASIMNARIGTEPFLQPLLREGVEGPRIINERNGKVVADRVLTAFDSESRRRGLLKEVSLDPSTAMIIAPTNAIHTFFMKFAIDIVFVSRDGRVLKIRPRVPAWRMTVSLRAYAVLELAAGSLDRSDTRVGDQLIVRATP